MKNKKSKLALLGGPKTFDKIGPHFPWPRITKKIERRVLAQLYKSVSIYNRSGIFRDFEDSFAEYHKRKFALLCSSGTLAIHTMFVAAGLKAGDEVICPAYTFFATVSPLLTTGAIPVLCDCDENGNIDPGEIEKKITSKTKAVVITHMWGVPCQMDKIVKLCKKNKLLLMEDCSHAHGATYNGKTVGSFGDMSAWSLQGAKTVTGGEGGVFSTNNEEFYYKALLLGHYNKRCKQEIPTTHRFHKYSVTGMGLKYRAHPLAIAIAMETFAQLSSYLQAKRYFVRQIISKLKNIKGLNFPSIKAGVNPSWYAFVFQYNTKELSGLPIEKFYEALQAEGLAEVDLPRSTSPLNLLPLFQKPQELFPVYSGHNSFSYSPGDFPRAEEFYRNAIKIPVWAFKSDGATVRAYIRGILKVLNNHRDLL